MKLSFKRQEKNKKRLSIFSGDDYLFSVSEYTYFKENLFDGMETDNISELKKRCDKAEFMNYALNIMSRHIYTKKSLRDKLKTKGCGDETADEIVNELSDKKILSDDSYKESYIYEAQTYKRTGIRRIKQELYFKGITAEDDDFDRELEEENLKELVKNLCEKNLEPKKIISRLVNKGYGISDVSGAIKNYINTDIDYYE